MKKRLLFVVLSVLVTASLACGVLGSGGSSSSGAHNTKFPVPGDASNFTEQGNGQINFQTNMSLKDTISYYRDAFTKQGLKERADLTSISGTTFSMVFDGDPSGQAIVVQGVDLGNGKTNVNIRYDKV